MCDECGYVSSRLDSFEKHRKTHIEHKGRPAFYAHHLQVLPFWFLEVWVCNTFSCFRVLHLPIVRLHQHRDALHAAPPASSQGSEDLS